MALLLFKEKELDIIIKITFSKHSYFVKKCIYKCLHAL